MVVGNKFKMAEAYKFSDLMKDNLKNAYRFFGESKNGATLIACSIAVFKGIFRPIFALTDKKTDPETRKYTAIREGLTEIAALPLYAVTPWIAGKIADALAKDVDKFTKNRIKTNAKFLGVCAATVIIPAVCNVIQPPIMNYIKTRQDAKKQKTEVAFEGRNNLTNPIKTVNSTSNVYANYGMRVGS